MDELDRETQYLIRTRQPRRRIPTPPHRRRLGTYRRGRRFFNKHSAEVHPVNLEVEGIEELPQYEVVPPTLDFDISDKTKFPEAKSVDIEISNAEPASSVPMLTAEVVGEEKACCFPSLGLGFFTRKNCKVCPEESSREPRWLEPRGKRGGKRKTKKARWTKKYKKSINCKSPRGFSQRQYCKYGRK